MNLRNAYQAAKSRLSPADREFRRIWPIVSRIEGWLVSPQQEQWLFNVARSLPDHANIVEIGSYKGRSTSCLAYGIKGTHKHAYAIDTFHGNNTDFKVQRAGQSYLDVFRANIAKNDLSRYVTPLPGFSAEVGRTWTRPIHFLFIDAGHEYEDVLSDFQTFYPFVVPGGLVAFHDVHNREVDKGPIGYPGVLRVWEEIARPLLTDHGTCATIAFGRKKSA
jgi:predicted O-methyltransferase YrrM